MSVLRRLGSRSPWAWVVAGVLIAACASTPPPDWQLTAKAALERAIIAHLSGNTRAEMAELESVRREIARTGRIDLLARAELAYCAARVAGLAFEPCTPFERLRDDAPVAERAYAAYLSARLQAADVALLPPAQRALAAMAPSASSLAPALQSIEDPLSRLVAAAVLLRSARADPTVTAIAVDTASAQGWRRPLLGWLKLQLELAEKAGAAADADRLRRRIALVQGEYAVVPKPH